MTRRPLRAGTIATSLLAAIGAASAQDGYVWAEVDCAASRIAPIAGATCRATNAVAGRDAAAGMSRRHSMRGVTPLGHVYVVMSEAVDGGAYVLTLRSTVEYLKLMDRRATDGSGWSATANHGDAEYHTFTSAVGESCVGFRRLGERRSGGFAWMMHGLLCAPEGQTLEPGQLRGFIDATRPR